MRVGLILAVLLLGGCATLPFVASSPAVSPQQRADRWTAHVAALSSDAMEGRGAGSEGFGRAAAYVVTELEGLGLEPAGTEGYGWFQPVALTEQTVDYAASSASLTTRTGAAPVALGTTALIASGRALPETIDAELVFIGYGLHMPSVGHDDLAGVDLRGKIAVFVSGGPANVAGSTKAHARAQRARLLTERGAVGAIALTTTAQLEAPWASAVRNAARPSMYFADAAMRPEAGSFIQLSWDPQQVQTLFAGTATPWAEVEAAANASQPLKAFPLDARFSGRFAGATRPVSTMNVVARLPGSDPTLAAEHVVISAHLDGLGIGLPINGDRINNGALDNAAGVAALLDMAEQLKRQAPRRSILFIFLTAEERGLLGSRYFARNPTVSRDSLVANLNYDMALSLFPLTGVTMLGEGESSIGETARAVGAQMGLPLVADPFPDRNSFIRSDQYGFIEQGLPAVAFKFGFAAGTPQAETERVFRATRYHQPSDDMTTPVFALDEVRLHDFIVALALRIADAPERPRWNDGSIFER